MRINTIVFATAVSIGVVATCVADAQAQTQIRVHSSGCYNAHNSGYLSDLSFGISNTASTSGPYESLVCPAPDTDVLPKANYGTVNIEAWVGSASEPLQGMLCEDQWNGSGGACSSPIQVGSGAGHETVALGSSVASVWNASTANNFGYVYINVGGGTRVAGIFYSR